MKVQLESTAKIVQIVVNDQEVPARVWEGTTESGIPSHAYITRIATDKTNDCAEFERELVEQRAPSVAIAALPLRIIL